MFPAVLFYSNTLTMRPEKLPPESLRPKNLAMQSFLIKEILLFLKVADIHTNLSKLVANSTNE
jgi:hypothetical protein